MVVAKIKREKVTTACLQPLNRKNENIKFHK